MASNKTFVKYILKVLTEYVDTFYKFTRISL